MKNIRITKENLSQIDTVTAVLNVLSIGELSDKSYTVEKQGSINIGIEFFHGFLEYYTILLMSQFTDFSKDEINYELEIAIPENFEKEIKNIELSGELPVFVNFRKKCMRIMLKNIQKFKNVEIKGVLSKINIMIIKHLEEIQKMDDRKGYYDKVEKFTEDSLKEFREENQNNVIDISKISRGCALIFFTYEYLINNSYNAIKEEIRKSLTRTEINLDVTETFMIFLTEIYKYWLLTNGKNYFMVKDNTSKNYIGKLTIDDKPVFNDKTFGQKYIALLLYMSFESMSTFPMYTTKEKTGCIDSDILTVNIEDSIWYAPNNISVKNKTPESDIIRRYYMLDPDIEKYAGGRPMMGMFISSANMVRRNNRSSNEFREMYELSTRYDKKTFYKKMYLEFNKLLSEFKNKEPNESEKVLIDLMINFKKSNITLVKNIEIQKAIYINRRYVENDILKNSLLVYNPNITDETSMEYKMLTVRTYVLDYVTEKNPEYTKETIQLISDIIMFIFSNNFNLFNNEDIMRSYDYMTEIAMYMSRVLNNEMDDEIFENTETLARIFQKSFEIYIDLLGEIGYNPQGRPANVEDGREQEKQFDSMWEQLEVKAITFDLKR